MIWSVLLKRSFLELLHAPIAEEIVSAITEKPKTTASKWRKTEELNQPLVKGQLRLIILLQNLEIC